MSYDEPYEWSFGCDRKMRIYFSHPGPLRESREKKRIINTLLGIRGAKIFDPLEAHKKYFDTPMEKWPYRQIVSEDRKAIAESDILVAWLPKAVFDFPRFYPKGTLFELAYAHEVDKPRFVLTDDEMVMLHPWIRTYATNIFAHPTILAEHIRTAYAEKKETSE